MLKLNFFESDLKVICKVGYVEECEGFLLFKEGLEIITLLGFGSVCQSSRFLTIHIYNAGLVKGNWC